MYFQSDYIMRMIESLHTFFLNLLTLPLEAMHGAELDRFLLKHCGIDLAALDRISVESLTETLPITPRMLLSEFLHLRADNMPMPDDEREACLTKSFRLLLSIGDEPFICKLQLERFLSLYYQTDPFLSAVDYAAAFRFAVNADAYATAEDILFFGLHTTWKNDTKMLLSEGLQGFSSLLSYPDNTLESGGLPRTEVLETISELKQQLGVFT